MLLLSITALPWGLRPLPMCWHGQGWVGNMVRSMWGLLPLMAVVLTILHYSWGTVDQTSTKDDSANKYNQVSWAQVQTHRYRLPLWGYPCCQNQPTSPGKIGVGLLHRGTVYLWYETPNPGVRPVDTPYPCSALTTKILFFLVYVGCQRVVRLNHWKGPWAQYWVVRRTSRTIGPGILGLSKGQLEHKYHARI